MDNNAGLIQQLLSVNVIQSVTVNGAYIKLSWSADSCQEYLLDIPITEGFKLLDYLQHANLTPDNQARLERSGCSDEKIISASSGKTLCAKEIKGISHHGDHISISWTSQKGEWHQLVANLAQAYRLAETIVRCILRA